MPTRKPRRDAGARVAARQQRAGQAIAHRAHRAIDRVHALAELEQLRDQASFIGDTIPGLLGIGHIAVVIFIPPLNAALAVPSVRRVSWHPDARDAYLAADAAAEADGGDHRARIHDIEQLVKDTP